MSAKLKTSTGKTAVNDISPAEKARIVIDGLSGEKPISEICRNEGITKSTFENWRKTFIDGGKDGLARSTAQSTHSSKSGTLEEELEKANATFNEALEAFDEGFVLWDSGFKLVIENQRMFNMLYPGEGPPRIAQPGDDFKLVLTEQFENGVYKKPDGVPVEQVIEMWKHMVMAYTKDVDIELADGRILSGSSHETAFGNYLLTFKDVTQIRAAEKAEREANMLLKTIVEACPTTFLVSRLDDGEIIYYPPASRDRFGDIQSTLEFFLKPEDRVAYLNALMPDGVLDDYPVRFRRRDGTIMQGLTSARVADYNGEDVIVSATRDVTDQIAMEAELERERNRAHQNEKLSALGELLAGVAHELNNPLSIVVGYSLMLQDKVKDPVQKQRVERIGQAAERCAKIVKMFLAMARQGPLQLETCSLNDVLQTVVDVVGSNLKASDVRLKLELEADLPNVEVDPDQIAQVFTNLIMNAENELAKKSGERRIKIISGYDDRSGDVVVKIRDNGAGIPVHIQRRIFEPFFTTKESGVGTGVGLALSHRIVTSHNGTLSVHSLEGKGATFFVRLKAIHDDVIPQTEMSDLMVAEKPLHICVVDDEIGVTTLITDILEEAGHGVTVHNDPLKAGEHLKSESFDIVLCDMKMPGMSGQEFYNQTIEETPSYVGRFAFITGDTMSASVSEFFRTAGVPHFEKPIVPNDFVQFIAKFQETRGGNANG